MTKMKHLINLRFFFHVLFYMQSVATRSYAEKVCGFSCAGMIKLGEEKFSFLLLMWQAMYLNGYLPFCAQQKNVIPCSSHILPRKLIKAVCRLILLIKLNEYRWTKSTYIKCHKFYCPTVKPDVIKHLSISSVSMFF